MDIIVYFEGDESVKAWLNSIINTKHNVIYKKQIVQGDLPFLQFVQLVRQC